MRLINQLLFTLLPLVAAVALTACAAEEGLGQPDRAETEDSAPGLRYLSLRLTTGDGESLYAVEDAAAPEYSDGSETEHAIDLSGLSQHVLILINSDWSYYGYSVLEFDRYSSQGRDPNVPSEDSYVGFLRPSDPSEAHRLPDYGLVVLNAYHLVDALDALAKQPKATLRDVLELVDHSSEGHIAGRSGGYFTMTSTAYLVNRSGEWEHSVLFEIDRSRVFDNRTSAVIQPAATAYVERMSAKFSLSLPGAVNGSGLHFLPNGGRAQLIVCNYVDGQPNYNNRTWTCMVEGWGINKHEPGSYYFRNIVGATTDTSVYPYTYGEDVYSTNSPFFNGWNNAAHRRAYWAVDPHYDEGIYPTQFRPAVDNPIVEYYGHSGTPSLDYLSYNDLSTDFGCLETEGRVSLYATENTFPDTRLSGHWQHDLGGCEVVIGARIHVNGVNEARPDYDLYRNRIGVVYPSATDFASYFISTANAQMASQKIVTYRYYDWSNPTNNNETVMKTLELPYSDYKLYFRGAPLTPEVMAEQAAIAMPATIENGDGKVIPWVEGMYIGRRDKDPDTYEEVGDVQRLALNANDFKSIIYDWIGAFDHFCQGRMVYSVPVRYRVSAERAAASNYRPTVGDYGVVRNNWYRLVIDGINNLGTPVDDPNQKIIPYEASLENTILTEINVLSWHGFDTDVKLPDHLK